MAVDLKRMAELMKKGWSWEGSGGSSGSSGSSVQPDWNQNDPNAADYVKNRTHYEEMTTVVFADNVTVEIGSDYSAKNPFTMDEIVEGQTYIVAWDGAAYECVAYIAAGPNVPSLGNGDLADAYGGNEEPFFITIFSGDLMVIADPGTHAVSVALKKENIVKLPMKYLPDIPILNEPVIVEKDFRWYGFTDGLDTLVLWGVNYYKVSDYTAAYNDILNFVSKTATGGSSTYFYNGTNCCRCGGVIIILEAGECALSRNGYEEPTSFTAPSAGLYFEDKRSMGTTYTNRLIMTVRELIKNPLITASRDGSKYFSISVGNDGIPTIMDTTDPTNIWTPQTLPTVTADNNGAFLRVVDGAWAATTLPNAEEASF